jgi:hypothetical protein
MKCYYHISVSQIGYRHLRPINPIAYTSGETFPAPQVLSKGLLVRVFLVHCYTLNPGSTHVRTSHDHPNKMVF